MIPFAWVGVKKQLLLTAGLAVGRSCFDGDMVEVSGGADRSPEGVVISGGPGVSAVRGASAAVCAGPLRDGP